MNNKPDKKAKYFAGQLLMIIGGVLAAGNVLGLIVIQISDGVKNKMSSTAKMLVLLLPLLGIFYLGYRLWKSGKGKDMEEAAVRNQALSPEREMSDVSPERAVMNPDKEVQRDAAMTPNEREQQSTAAASDADKKQGETPTPDGGSEMKKDGTSDSKVVPEVTEINGKYLNKAAEFHFGIWHQIDYLLTFRYGYSHMLAMTQTAASLALHVDKVWTSQGIGQKEVDCTEAFKEAGGNVFECEYLSHERGVISIAGAFDQPIGLAKIVFINQVNILRVFVPEIAGTPRKDVDKFVNELLEKALGSEKEPDRFEVLFMQYAQASKTAPDASETHEIRRKLVEELMKKKCLYVLMDQDFNPNFPYMDLDGRAEVFTEKELADAAVNHIEKNMGHVRVRAFEQDAAAKIFETMRYQGIHVFRLNNGTAPVGLWLRDMPLPEIENLLERKNRDLRGLFLRELQYGYRDKKMDEDKKNDQRSKMLKEYMLTMRYNGYRSFGQGLCYVLCGSPDDSETTYYTAKAMEQAKRMLSEEGLTEKALCAPGTSQTEIYEGPLQLRVVNRPGSMAISDAMVCAFSGYEEAELVRNQFRKSGIKDGILVVTFEELCSQATQCAGILLDMPTYGLELPKAEFADIYTWKEFQSAILVSLGNKS